VLPARHRKRFPENASRQADPGLRPGHLLHRLPRLSQLLYGLLQDLGFGRRAARLAVQCVFRNEEETRSESLSLIRWRPNGV
jgi:hypothetical protein